MPFRILVVDDSPVNRVVAEAKLKEAGFEAVMACDGAEALTALGLDSDAEANEWPIDAVLLDIMMPGIDGMEVLDEIRLVWNSIQLPVIMATAKDQRSDVLEALMRGANDYVTKPLDLQILLARLNTHLNLKANHEALKKAQNALVNAARIESTGLLAAGVAHEIRNPLGRIQMAASGLAALTKKLPETDQEMATIIITTITEATDAADDIVKGLMKASENQQLNLEPADLNEAILEAVEILGPEIEAAGVTVVYELDKECPPVLLAAEEFQRALLAVILNSIQAMKTEGGEIRQLTLRTSPTTLTGIGAKEGGRSGNRARDGDDVVALQIEDTGPGMTGDQTESAFDAFYTTRATGSGTGLGLTVARKIIDLHHGVIRLENRDDVDSGLRATIFLKVKGGMRTNV